MHWPQLRWKLAPAAAAGRPAGGAAPAVARLSAWRAAYAAAALCLLLACGVYAPSALHRGVRQAAAPPDDDLKARCPCIDQTVHPVGAPLVPSSLLVVGTAPMLCSQVKTYTGEQRGPTARCALVTGCAFSCSDAADRARERWQAHDQAELACALQV